jgi:hypothetical protein
MRAEAPLPIGKVDPGLCDASTRIDLARVPEMAREVEEIGYDDLASGETKNDPFVPLALGATTTSPVWLTTAVAIAFPRSPTAVAMTAWDLQAMSKGYALVRRWPRQAGPRYLRTAPGASRCFCGPGAVRRRPRGQHPGGARLGLKTLHFVDEQAVARQRDLITSWDIHEVLDDRSSGEQHDRRPAVAAGRRGKPRVFLEARVGIGRGMALLFLSSHHRAGDD